MSILSTTLTTLTFFTTLPLLLHNRTPQKAGVLLALYHIPPLFLHPYILRTNDFASNRYNLCSLFATALYLASALLNSALLYPFAYLLLGVGNSGLQTIAALTQPPNTLSMIDLLGTLASALAPSFYLFHANAYIPFTLLLASFLTTLSSHQQYQESQPLLKTPSDTCTHSSISVITWQTVRPLSMMLFSTASLTLLLPQLATKPSPTTLSLLALSALSEPLSTNLLHLKATRVTFMSTLITALGAHLLQRNINIGTLLLGAGASASAVVSVADMAHSAHIVFDVRSPISLIAGVTFAVGHILGCLAGAFFDISRWSLVSLVAIFIAATPFLTPLLRSGVRSTKSFFEGHDANNNVQ